MKGQSTESVHRVSRLSQSDLSYVRTDERTDVDVSHLERYRSPLVTRAHAYDDFPAIREVA